MLLVLLGILFVLFLILLMVYILDKPKERSEPTEKAYQAASPSYSQPVSYSSASPVSYGGIGGVQTIGGGCVGGDCSGGSPYYNMGGAYPEGGYTPSKPSPLQLLSGGGYNSSTLKLLEGGGGNNMQILAQASQAASPLKLL